MNFELEVQYAADSVDRLPAQQQVKDWVQAALRARIDECQLVVRIVEEEESRQLNERYRHRQGATNVLSFPFEEPALLQPPLLGDVVICAPRVELEAREQGKEAEAHWAHLVVHGVLHLLGYDHEHDKQAKIMEDLETEILASLGYPDPYAGAAAAQGRTGSERPRSGVPRHNGSNIAVATKQETDER